MKDEFECGGRKFVLIQEDQSDAWTFKEVMPDGERVDPDDVMGCSGPKGFVEFHVRSQVK